MRFIILIIITLIFISCSSTKIVTTEISNKNYKLITTSTPKSVLVVFPGFGDDISSTVQDFAIHESANNADIAVLYMNFNMKLYLSNSEKRELSNKLIKALSDNKLLNQKIVIGGFSSGGNVALIISDYLLKNRTINLVGVFSVDSPIDLIELRKSYLRTIKYSNSQVAVNEAHWILNKFQTELGVFSIDSSQYYAASPVVTSESICNLINLKNLSIRFYTEPDIDWWKNNRDAEPEDLNATYLKKSIQIFKDNGNTDINLIETNNKGYRPDGSRHPHSWSIVDHASFINWVKML